MDNRPGEVPFRGDTAPNPESKSIPVRKQVQLVIGRNHSRNVRLASMVLDFEQDSVRDSYTISTASPQCGESGLRCSLRLTLATPNERR